MWEFAPGWSNARMTKSQIKKYIADMKAAQKAAKEKLKKAQDSWAFEKDAEEVKKLENILNNL